MNGLQVAEHVAGDILARLEGDKRKIKGFKSTLKPFVLLNKFSFICA